MDLDFIAVKFSRIVALCFDGDLTEIRIDQLSTEHIQRDELFTFYISTISINIGVASDTFHHFLLFALLL